MVGLSLDGASPQIKLQPSAALTVSLGPEVGRICLDCLVFRKDGLLGMLCVHVLAAGSCCDQQGCVLAGKAGVALSTLGPGATNMTTSAAYAQLGGFPALLITGAALNTLAVLMGRCVAAGVRAARQGIWLSGYADCTELHLEAVMFALAWTLQQSTVSHDAFQARCEMFVRQNQPTSSAAGMHRHAALQCRKLCMRTDGHTS